MDRMTNLCLSSREPSPVISTRSCMANLTKLKPQPQYPDLTTPYLLETICLILPDVILVGNDNVSHPVNFGKDLSNRFRPLSRLSRSIGGLHRRSPCSRQIRRKVLLQTDISFCLTKRRRRMTGSHRSFRQLVKSVYFCDSDWILKFTWRNFQND